MSINTIELSGLLREASELSNKRNWDKQDERRNGYLLSAISAVKAGASLADVNHDYLNAEEQRMNLPLTKRDASPLTLEQRAQAREFQSFAVQKRDNEGNPISRIGTYSGLGYFSPTEFFSSVFEGMKQHDPIFDNAAFTQIRSTNGRVMTLPTLSDTENDASVLGEA